MPPSDQPQLRHQLNTAQMTMLGVGGSIGTGLLLGSGAAIQTAGPAVILSYIVGSVLSLTVAFAMAELAAAHPDAGSFGLYAELYLNRWAGFLARFGYWASLVTAMGGELVASATYMHFWFPGVSGVVWVVLFAVFLLGANLLAVGHYGWFEYGFAMIKVATIAAFIALGAGLLMTGRVSAQYTASSGGFFPNGYASPLVATSFALFSFLGVEMVAISSGEARSPREIARAMAWTFAVLTLVYLGAVTVLMGVMPWRSAGTAQSPFVTVFAVAHIPAAADIMNFVVLTAALSGANASLYSASRMLFSMARTGTAPSAFGALTADGRPMRAVFVSAFGILVAVVMIRIVPEKAFLYIIGASLFGGMLAWWVTLLAHAAFRNRVKPEELANLPLRSPLGAAGSIFGAAGIFAAIAATWWTMRVTVYSGVALVLVLSLFYALMKKSRARNTISA